MRQITCLVMTIFLFSHSALTFANDQIDVLVGVTVKAMDNGVNPFTTAIIYQTAVRQALDNSGIGLSGGDITFYAYPLPVSYIGDSNPGSSILTAFFALQGGGVLAFTAAREGLVPYSAPGFDLMLMVGWDFEENGMVDCGLTERPLDFSNAFNSEIFAFVVINGVAECSELLVNFVLPHEIGHLLGGEHQVAGGTKEDTTPNIPVMYNHPVFTPDDYTVLASPGFVPDLTKLHRQYSNPGNGTLPGTTIPAGSATEDNHRLFTETTWDMVAAYRPLPLPPVVMGDAEYAGCNGNFGLFLIKWWEILNSTPVGTFVVERKSGLYWYPYFGGRSGCVGYSSDGQTNFRVRGINSGGSSAWAYFNAYHSCYGGGGGPVQ